MGCRKIALILKQPGFGRDKTEALLMAYGFRVNYPPNYIKTTHGVRLGEFDNLIEWLVIKKRPHWSLEQQMTLVRFEEYVNKLRKAKHPKMMIYKHQE